MIVAAVCVGVAVTCVLLVLLAAGRTLEAHELDGYPEPGTVEADADLELMSWDNRAAGDPWPRGVS